MNVSFWNVRHMTMTEEGVKPARPMKLHLTGGYY